MNENTREILGGLLIMALFVITLVVLIHFFVTFPANVCALQAAHPNSPFATIWGKCIQ
jgi:hypothetical protein